MSEGDKLLVSVRVQLNHLALGTLLALLELEPLKYKGELEIGFDNGEPYVWVGPTRADGQGTKIHGGGVQLKEVKVELRGGKWK